MNKLETLSKLNNLKGKGNRRSKIKETEDMQ